MPRAISDPALQQRMDAYAEEHRATPPQSADVKWRFFWPLRLRSHSQAGSLDADRVVPAGLPQWACTMDGWGQSMLDTVETVSELLALGYGLPPSTFSALLADGKHLLAPTGARPVSASRLRQAHLTQNGR